METIKNYLYNMEEINYETVSFKNIDSEDFTGYWGGKPYLIKAGEVKHYPEFLALHFAKHLEDYIMQKKKIGLREFSERSKIESEILGVIEKKEEILKEQNIAEQSSAQEEEAFAELQKSVKKAKK